MYEADLLDTGPDDPVVDRSSVFRELYERYADDVYRFALWLGADRRDAEDITSETFARALASNTPIRAATAKAYLLTIARRYLLELRRRTQAHVPLTDVLPDSNPPPDILAERRSEATSAREAMARLPDDERTALVMRALHEMSYEEIARALGISVVAAKVRVHRARKRLTTAPNGTHQ